MRATAETLQRALLPSAVRSLQGVELAARYRSAGDHERIGGDWHDSIALPGGGLALVIGDVEGHDLAAASVMGLVRGAVRSYALEGHPPLVLLERVNTFLFSTDIEHLVTLAYLQLYPDDRMVTVALAGHPVPIVAPRDGAPAVLLDAPTGPPLGVDPAARWEERTLLLPHGCDVVMYTDGLVDFPGAPPDQVEVLLRTVSAAQGAGIDHLLDEVVARAPHYDDVALLVARPAAPHRPSARRTLPVQRMSAGIARRWIADLIALWEASGELAGCGRDTDDVADLTQLLVTELVSNAVRHSDLSVGVSAALTAGRLRIDVSDSSHRMPVLRRPEAGDTAGRGLVLVDTLADAWGVELEEQGKAVWFEVDLTAAPGDAEGPDADVDALLAAWGS